MLAAGLASELEIDIHLYKSSHQIGGCIFQNRVDAIQPLVRDRTR
jgi:hypothetical protein